MKECTITRVVSDERTCILEEGNIAEESKQEKKVDGNIKGQCKRLQEIPRHVESSGIKTFEMLK